MICYKCGGALGAGKHCLNCGADVSVYRKIVKLSNSYYNGGLEKAKVGDLSGAVLLLKKALEYDKRNTDARNLLGLVYYEMGEVVYALAHWVVSKNFKTTDNMADYYLTEVQGDEKKLDEQNQAIIKFNQALDYAKHDGEDLAIIKLKGIISQYPHFLKAYRLLALLLIKEGEFSKANKIIKRGLVIDAGNTDLLYYASEIKGKISKKKLSRNELIESTTTVAGADVVVPQYKERPKAIQLLTGAAIGVGICLLAYIFLIRPSVEKRLNNDLNQNAVSYYEKNEGKDEQIQKLSDELEKIKTEMEFNKSEIEKFTGENGSITNYDRILTAISQYQNKQYPELIDTYAKINPDTITSESFTSAYKFLGKFIGSDNVLSSIMQKGLDLFNAGKYSDCREVCKQCLAQNPDFAEAIYYMGLSYEAQGDDASAAPYFLDIVNRFPACKYYELAKKRVS